MNSSFITLRPDCHANVCLRMYMRLFHIFENRVFSFSVDSLFCCYLKNSLILYFECEFHECPFLIFHGIVIHFTIQ